MREALKDLVEAVEAGHTVGLGTVVRTFRSAPRPAGGSMMVDAGGLAVGSVSGGCVEGALYELATAVAEDGTPVLQRYGISDDDAFEVGLTCGGIIDLWIERVDPERFPELGDVAHSVETGEPVAVVTCIEGPADRLGKRLVIWPDRRSGSLGTTRLDDAVTDD